MIVDPHNVLIPSENKKYLSGTSEELAKAMDNCGVDLCGIYSRDNELVAAAVDRFPDRLFGMAWVLPGSEDALERLEFALKTLKFKGLKLNMPSALAALRSNSVMDPIYSLLIDYEAVLLAHSAEGDHIFSLPYLFEQVARSFPKLKIIMAHIGVPDDYEEAIRIATWNKNVFLSTHAAPSSVIRMAVKRAGPNKVLLGTDWPYEDFAVEMLKVKMAVPNSVDRDLVLGTNATHIFGLSS